MQACATGVPSEQVLLTPRIQSELAVLQTALVTLQAAQQRSLGAAVATADRTATAVAGTGRGDTAADVEFVDASVGKMATAREMGGASGGGEGGARKVLVTLDDEVHAVVDNNVLPTSGNVVEACLPWPARFQPTAGSQVCVSCVHTMWRVKSDEECEMRNVAAVVHGRPFRVGWAPGILFWSLRPSTTKPCVACTHQRFFPMVLWDA